jgi:hypothetical protein
LIILRNFTEADPTMIFSVGALLWSSSTFWMMALTLGDSSSSSVILFSVCFHRIADPSGVEYIGSRVELRDLYLALYKGVSDGHGAGERERRGVPTAIPRTAGLSNKSGALSQGRGGLGLVGGKGVGELSV